VTLRSSCSLRLIRVCSEVHKATYRPTATPVALKRILMHNEKEGMPITALREIRILKRLSHPNVVQLREVIVQGSPPSFHMVFPYMDHDLAGLLENDRVQMTPSQIKLYMRQLLEGTAYLHAVGAMPMVSLSH
jgi:serine/threonine-protein kinase BUR1